MSSEIRKNKFKIPHEKSTVLSCTFDLHFLNVTMFFCQITEFFNNRLQYFNGDLTANNMLKPEYEILELSGALFPRPL